MVRVGHFTSESRLAKADRLANICSVEQKEWTHQVNLEHPCHQQITLATLILGPTRWRQLNQPGSE